MNDKVFLDTNILVYAYSVTEPQKQSIARQVINDHFSFISTQVLQELTNTVIKKSSSATRQLLQLLKNVVKIVV